MRMLAPLLALTLASACSKGESYGKEEAAKEAEAEEKERQKNSKPAEKLATPVPRGKKVSCARLIDTAAFQDGLGIDPKEPIVVKEQREVEASAACGIFRGGKPPTAEEQQKMLKKDGKLGLLPQDELCNVVAYCWTIESLDNVKKACKEKKPARGTESMIEQKDDESMGNYACTQVMKVGKYDVQNFRFFDDDTKCILFVRGGASQVDNDAIRRCARIARDTITPERIVPGEPPAPPPTPATGSGSGDKKGG